MREKDGVPFIHVVNANFMKGISAQKISDECNKIWQKNVLEESGVDSRTIEESTLSLPYTEESVGDMDVTGYILGLAVVFIMFLQYIITATALPCLWHRKRPPGLWRPWWSQQNHPGSSSENVWQWAS